MSSKARASGVYSVPMVKMLGLSGGLQYIGGKVTVSWRSTMVKARVWASKYQQEMSKWIPLRNEQVDIKK